MNVVCALLASLSLAIYLDDSPVPRPPEVVLLGEDPAALARAVRREGDAARGAAVFFMPALTCTKCHDTGEPRETALGPNLARLGKDATDEYLIESVLKPSQAIKKGFETVTIATIDGKNLAGLLAEDRPDRIIVRDPAQDGKLVTISKQEIDARKDDGPSIMPAGLVNALSSRQQFLDLIRYLREIADGGPERARALRPDPAQVPSLILPEYEAKIDHAGMIAALGPESLKRGEAIYHRVCVNCHGTQEKPGSLPTSLRFSTGRFKNGNDIYSLYRTLTFGFGQMPPQTWMVPSQKYDVIHYIRETYLRHDNPTQYAHVNGDYLARLPKGTTRGPEPSTIEPWSAMDYGPTLLATYEVGGTDEDNENFAFKGIAIRLDGGPGGVSRGRHWTVFDHDTLRLAAAWTGDGFIDWNGVNFNGRHDTHPRIVGRIQFDNPDCPGWANPETGAFDDLRQKGRDGLAYGPLPRSWAHYNGQFRHGDQVVLAYTVGTTNVLEKHAVETDKPFPVFTRTFNFGSRDRTMVLQVARGPKAPLSTIASGDGTRPAVAYVGPIVSSGPEPSLADRGLRFEGSSFVEIPASDDIDMVHSDFTICARFQTRRGGTLFCETAPGSDWVPDGKSFFVRNGRLAFDIGWAGDVESKRRVDDGKWHVGVLTYERAKGRSRLFIDGLPDEDETLKQKKPLPSRALRIGYTARDFPEPNSYFHGRIAEIQFYRRVLATDAIRNVMTASDDALGLVARWRPDEAHGQAVHDETGHGLDGKVIHKESTIAEQGGIVASVSPAFEGLAWSTTSDGDLRLAIPQGESTLRFNLQVARVASVKDAKALASSISNGPAADLSALTRGGPARWPEILKTSIKRGRDLGPFAVDTLELPENNPWLCQLRLTGIDFLDRGRRAAICTWDGDVWLASGIDAPAGEISWQRIASGLFQPLGLKVLDGKIFVSCRDQIVLLRDQNGDGETDFYENFNSDHQVTEHFHEFAMGLQTDAAGNFYYAKAARHGKTALVPQHGTLLRVSADGLRTDILATGFRAPNGVCVNGDGTFFLTDQEGFWTPKNRINHVKVGGFYGNMWGYHDITDPSDSAMEPPVCWITNAFDRSPAELVRVTSPGWGPLDGSLLNLSYGNGKIFVVPYERVGGAMQGGMCALPIPPLPTGVMRGRFHPGDGQLYACGMFAWAGDRTAPGGFYRVRATGRPMLLPIALHAKKSGLQITFTGPIDRASAVDRSRYSLKTWSLRRTDHYGSDHFDEKALRVAAASLADDGRSVVLAIPDIQPTWGMEIRYRLRGSSGEPCEGTIHNTINHLAD
jgi:putative heme-binding domain-containing protein